MQKEKLKPQDAKKRFMETVRKNILAKLDERGRDCEDLFVVQGGSIICELPSDFFSNYELPPGFKIEMKFIAKQ